MTESLKTLSQFFPKLRLVRGLLQNINRLSSLKHTQPTNHPVCRPTRVLFNFFLSQTVFLADQLQTLCQKVKQKYAVRWSPNIKQHDYNNP